MEDSGTTVSQPASQPVVTSTRGFGATASKVSVVDRPGVLPRLSSIGNLTGVNTGYYCVSICNYLSLTLNSYFHHNQTRPRTKNYKNTKWIFDWINHRPAEFTSILGNDKNLKEDLILRSKNYKIIFEIQSGEPSPDWVVLSGSGSRAALMIETFFFIKIHRFPATLGGEQVAVMGVSGAEHLRKLADIHFVLWQRPSYSYNNIQAS